MKQVICHKKKYDQYTVKRQLYQFKTTIVYIFSNIIKINKIDNKLNT